jgi:hypothetical protein
MVNYNPAKWVELHPQVRVFMLVICSSRVSNGFYIWGNPKWEAQLAGDRASPWRLSDDSGGLGVGPWLCEIQLVLANTPQKLWTMVGRRGWNHVNLGPCNCLGKFHHDRALESWFISGKSSPFMASRFRWVKYYNWPRYMSFIWTGSDDSMGSQIWSIFLAQASGNQTWLGNHRKKWTIKLDNDRTKWIDFCHVWVPEGLCLLLQASSAGTMWISMFHGQQHDIPHINGLVCLGKS